MQEAVEAGSSDSRSLKGKGLARLRMNSLDIGTCPASKRIIISIHKEADGIPKTKQSKQKKHTVPSNLVPVRGKGHAPWRQRVLPVSPGSATC